MLRTAVGSIALSIAVLAGVLGAPLPSAGAEVLHEAVGEVLDGLPEPSRGFAAAADGARTSAPVATPIPFSMAGFEVPIGAEVELRTSVDGVDWTDWTHVDVHPEEGPDPGSPERAGLPADRALSHPVWVSEARHLQLRVAGASPRDVDVHLIDTKGLSLSPARRTVDALAQAWRGTAPAAAAEVARPAIVTREQWGANESWRRGTNSAAATARALFVHHTVNSNAYTQAEARGLVQGIYRYHTQSNGWSDIGYNLLVDRFGTIYEGRHGGLERAIIGAHAGGFNTGTVGVAVIGDFGNVGPGQPARAALEQVLAWKADLHHIDAASQVTLTSAGSTRYPSGQQVRLSTISGHRDVSATACPGAVLYAELPSLRTAVAAAVGPLFVQPSVSPTLVRLSQSGTPQDRVAFAAGVSPSGPWQLRVTDERGATVHASSGTGTSVSSSWTPPPLAGSYRYELTGGTRRPVTGELLVLRDVVDRIGTAATAAAASVEIARAAFPDGGTASHAVLARADVFADAMAGGPLAGRTAPLLLTPSTQLDAGVRAELERVLPRGRTVYVLGGTEAISDDVLTALRSRWTVERLSGRERTATAAAVAQRVLAASGARTAMVARAGPDSAFPWADALAGGAYGAREGIPVLLTHTNELAGATRDVLRGVDRTIVLGGTSAVSEPVAAQLPSPQRISGGDRTGTAVAIAEQLWGRTRGSANDVVLVGGGFQTSSWTLALAASPLAARTGAPLLLTSGTTLSPSTRAHLERLGYGATRPAGGVVLGGRAAVADEVAQEVSRLLQ